MDDWEKAYWQKRQNDLNQQRNQTNNHGFKDVDVQSALTQRAVNNMSQQRPEATIGRDCIKFVNIDHGYFGVQKVLVRSEGRCPASNETFLLKEVIEEAYIIDNHNLIDAGNLNMLPKIKLAVLAKNLFSPPIIVEYSNIQIKNNSNSPNRNMLLG